ncbi:hypothetical protein V6N12_034093 [Hibiscus sabdariffa]|uniref:Uncharacterized protein n=1 Tax=Hibiscus sabdariffa TaxID=183260 RepID=A0ABR2BGR5_9ROSI
MADAIWAEIEQSESFMVCSMCEEAASLASSIIKKIGRPNLSVDDGDFEFDLYEAMVAAGMVLVQSLKQLSRTSAILNELKTLFVSVEAIPVQVLLTGVCFQISEGSTVGAKEFLEEYISKWRYVDGHYYVLASAERSLNFKEGSDSYFVLGADKYIQVVELYAVMLLGTVSSDVDLAISWVEQAALPEKNRQELLRRLHSLHSTKVTHLSQGSLSHSPLANHESHPSAKGPNVPEGTSRSLKASYLINGEKDSKQSNLKLYRQSHGLLSWFRNITLKFGNHQMVISNGKILIACLILFAYYIIRRKGVSLRRIVKRQALFVKKSLVDLWELAFSFQNSSFLLTPNLLRAKEIDQILQQIKAIYKLILKEVEQMSTSFAEAFPAMQETLLEFRAGKMLLEGKRVVPDTRKGLIRIARGEEGLVHFQWLDRTQNVIEDDQIVFPDEAVFEKVNQASSRVYILKFNTDDRKFFFWMQEPKAEDDSQLCIAVNNFINQPLEFGVEEPDASEPLQVSEDMIEDDISSRAGNLTVPNLGAEAISDVTSSSGPVKLEDLQRILSSIGPAEIAGDPDGGLGLDDILKPDLIMPLIESLSLEERLASYLPEGQWRPEDLLELLQSPPFRQQVDSFTYVLRTGQIDLSQFGIDPSKYKFTVLSFLEALEDSVSKLSESGETQQDDKDVRPQSCNRNDPMDESK